MLILIGKTCSGKNLIRDKLISEFGFHENVTYTTRPMRKGEINGETYHFISDDEFNEKVKNGFFLEWQEYVTSDGIWKYGSSKENYANVDWSGNDGYDKNDPKTYFSTMGCRTANTWDINGFGQLKDGRGNICPVTIIMPTLAMEAESNAAQEQEMYGTSNIVEEFMNILDTKIHEAKDMLLERFEWICSQSPDSAKFMYENGVMEGYIPEEGIISALKHGTLGVGQIGLL